MEKVQVVKMYGLYRGDRLIFSTSNFSDLEKFLEGVQNGTYSIKKEPPMIIPNTSGFNKKNKDE